MWLAVLRSARLADGCSGRLTLDSGEAVGWLGGLAVIRCVVQPVDGGASISFCLSVWLPLGHGDVGQRAASEAIPRDRDLRLDLSLPPWEVQAGRSEGARLGIITKVRDLTHGLIRVMR